ncbi:GntR family transcriptional regulator [Hoeflea sp. CAU 1731]
MPTTSEETAQAGKPARHQFAIDRKRPAAIQVYEDLRSRIISLELKPGESLSRLELVQQYGVSQTPVRDAFILLEKEGLIEVYPQSKTLVSKIDIAQARETQFLRTAVELEVGRVLARSDDRSLTEEARHLWQLQERVLETENWIDRFRDLDARFHAALAEAAGQANLWDLIISRSGHIDRLRNLHLPDAGKAATVLSDHRGILDAIEASDQVHIAEAIRKHLSGTLSAVDLIVSRYPDYF